MYRHTYVLQDNINLLNLIKLIAGINTYSYSYISGKTCTTLIASAY